MNRTALISGIRKDFRNGFKHAGALISDDQTYTSKPAFFQLYEERTPAFTILFHPFRSAKDFPAAILTDANGNENRNVLDLAAPTTFQVNTIYVNIGIVPSPRKAYGNAVYGNVKIPLIVIGTISLSIRGTLILFSVD